MSATDELRRMLDERGITWDDHCEPRHTWFDSPTMGRIIVFEMQTGGLIIKPEPLTTEQVIAATVGRDTCHITYCEDDYGMDGWLCDGCGEWFAATYNHTPTNNIRHPHFCPNCGRRVVQP